ncbi:MAG: methyltransferase domain-containing protein [Candidatus Omnitrophota bacterium]
MKSSNPFRRWLHGNRYRIIRSLVKGFYRPGKVIADFGSASCCWNPDRLPVIGVDLNENSLIHGKNQGRLTDFSVADIANSGLADNSCDIIVSTETLEHIADIDLVLAEMYRILKPGGVIVLSVPHDTPFSLWKMFFSLQVLYQSYFCGSAYYKKQCGHIQHFSPKSLRSIVKINGFKIWTDFSFFNFHLFITAYKQCLPLEKSCKDLTLIIPLNNEEDKLKPVLNNLISQYPGATIICVEDGSNDKTTEIIMATQSICSDIKLLDGKDKKIKGLTVSVCEAIKLVNTVYFIVMDGDGQYLADNARLIYNNLKSGSDICVLGRIEGDNWFWHRQLISCLARSMGTSLLRQKTKKYPGDILNGFFGVNTEFWRKKADGNSHIVSEVIARGR